MTRIEISPNLASTKVHDDLVIMNLDTDQFYGFNATALIMWNTLQAQPTLDDAIEALTQQLDAPREQLVADLHQFIDDLVARDLVTVVDDSV